MRARRPALASVEPHRGPRPESAPWRWALAGALLGLALTLALFAPAAWLAAAVQQASGGRVQLDEPRGTLWRGSARLVLSGGAGSQDRTALPGRLDWRLLPHWSGLRALLQADCCMGQPLRLALAPRWGGASLLLTDPGSRWPAALLAGLGAPWNTLQPEGQLDLSTPGLSVEWAAGRVSVTGSATLMVKGLSSRLSTLKPMGTYRIQLQGGQPATVALATLEGGLQLSGSGRWIGSRLHFQGVASAAPEHEAALANLLNIVGRRSGPRSLITVD
ncbi:type II secretion system protein N [Ramlibacter sp. 2FC]|uniref:type II secretion system protein N n=1 Tax=Ramlibacter sp. 2FC TaxID=2502188 RepID=UPI0010F61074|nr:type II secretion system protein N [Ramlibacter sp. 2FC]